MKFKKEKFHVIVYVDYEKPVKKLIDGYSFVYRGKKWFVHKKIGDNCMWSVTDPYTGCNIATRFTRKKAINAFIDYIYKDQTVETIKILMEEKRDLMTAGIKLPVNR
jgi:hypothetical protein